MLRVAVDIDEVLCPMLQNLRAHHRLRTRRALPTRSPKKYDYADHLGITPNESKLLVKSFYSGVCCNSMEPLEGSQEALRKLKQKYKLSIVTGRQKYASSKRATYNFLDDYFHDVFDSIHFANSYSLIGDEVPKATICKDIHASILIDDSIANCKEASDAGIQGVLFGEYSWNEDAPEHMARINNWLDYEHYL